jgi:hypothetical protein
MPVFVGHHHDRLPELFVQAGEEVQDRRRGRRVEVRAGFVGEEDGRSVHQGPRDRHPLLLATGEFGRAVVHPPLQSDIPEDLPAHVETLLTREAPHQAGEDHILLHCQFRDEGVVLEDIAQSVQPKTRLLPPGEGKDVFSVDRDRARGRDVEEAHRVEEGGLPRPARPHDPDELPLLDGEGDAPQGADRHRPEHVGPGEVADDDHAYPLTASRIGSCAVFHAGI